MWVWANQIHSTWVNHTNKNHKSVVLWIYEFLPLLASQWINFTKYWLKFCWLRTISAAWLGFLTCSLRAGQWDDLYQQEHRGSNCEVYLELLCSCWGDTVQALDRNLCPLLDSIPVIPFLNSCMSLSQGVHWQQLSIGHRVPGISLFDDVEMAWKYFDDDIHCFIDRHAPLHKFRIKGWKQLRFSL